MFVIAVFVSEVLVEDETDPELVTPGFVAADWELGKKDAAPELIPPVLATEDPVLFPKKETVVKNVLVPLRMPTEDAVDIVDVRCWVVSVVTAPVKIVFINLQLTYIKQLR